MNPQREFLTRRYGQLWNDSIGLVRRGEASLDRLLASRQPDRRRCITLLIRPPAEVQRAVGELLERLRQIDPGQYYYAPEELHVTVLSLFTATLDHERHLVRYDDYLAAVNTAVAQARAFGIEFTGVTLTQEAVMIQGFPETAALNDLREALRQELRSRQLTEGLDSRYVLQTAHMTVVRFRDPMSDSDRFVEVLERYRGRDFGRTKARELSLVRNDWYMSQASVEVLQGYALPSGVRDSK